MKLDANIRFLPRRQMNLYSTDEILQAVCAYLYFQNLLSSDRFPLNHSISQILVETLLSFEGVIFFQTGA